MQQSQITIRTCSKEKPFFYIVKHVYRPAGGKEINHQITRQK